MRFESHRKSTRTKIIIRIQKFSLSLHHLSINSKQYSYCYPSNTENKNGIDLVSLISSLSSSIEIVNIYIYKYIEGLN